MAPFLFLHHYMDATRRGEKELPIWRRKGNSWRKRQLQIAILGNKVAFGEGEAKERGRKAPSPSPNPIPFRLSR